MGKKIPGKKHRGVKDPHKQAEERLASIAGKINRPPPLVDNQEVPKSVLRIMEFQEKLKKTKQKKRQKKKKTLLNTADFLPKEVDLPGMKRPVKVPAVVSQLPGESKYHFLQRIEQSCMQSMREALFEEEFNVQVKRDPQTHDIIDVVKERKDEVQEIIEKAKESRKRRKKKPTLRKSEKRKAKLVAKAEIKSERGIGRDFTDYKDEVKFGEVVHQPPQLNVIPKSKVKIKSTEGRPGRKELLLKSILKGDGSEKKTLLVSERKKEQGDTIARKKMLEQERKRVVQLYRLMKNKDSVT